MKFSFIKSKFRKIPLERFMAGIIIFAVVVGMMPRVASADSRNALNEAKFAQLEQILEELRPKKVDFPVSEEKDPIRGYNVVITAYSSEVAQTDSTPCIPANGYNLCKHYEEFGYGNTVANNCLPLGTQIRFPDLYGDKVFIVRDRMNKRYGCYRMDIWMEGRPLAKQFGVKRSKVEIFGRTLARSR